MKSISFRNLLGQNKHIFKKQLYLSHLPTYIHVIELAVYTNMDLLHGVAENILMFRTGTPLITRHHWASKMCPDY